MGRLPSNEDWYSNEKRGMTACMKLYVDCAAVSKEVAIKVRSRSLIATAFSKRVRCFGPYSDVYCEMLSIYIGTAGKPCIRQGEAG